MGRVVEPNTGVKRMILYCASSSRGNRSVSSTFKRWGSSHFYIGFPSAVSNSKPKSELEALNLFVGESALAVLQGRETRTARRLQILASGNSAVKMAEIPLEYCTHKTQFL